MDKVSKRLREIILSVSREMEAHVHTLEIMPDHVHLFLESDPRWSISEITNRIKGASSRILRSEFPHLRSRIPTLWSRSYFAGTVGNVSKSTVRRYIESQKGK